MPIDLPNLDDRTYADLMVEARSMIPNEAPKWTNYNPSDPGITFIELFAYLAEMLIYRLNRVTDDNVRAFLKLIDGVERVDGTALSEEVGKVVRDLRKPTRAVTSADFEALVLAAFEGKIARARAVSRRNLEPDDPEARASNRPGHVSVIVVPLDEKNQPKPVPTLEMIQAVKDYLEPRRLLTTRVHVVGPRYATVGVRLTLHIKPDAIDETVRKAAIGELVRFFDPLRGGKDERGWPFGRDLWVSEIYELLDRLPGVDFVTQTFEHDKPLNEFVADPWRLIKRTYVDSNSGERKEALVGVSLDADELVAASIDAKDITIVSPMTIV